MEAIVYRAFGGEVPRTEPHLLRDEQAQLALNCQFESGALCPTRDAYLMANMANNPVRGLYTEDGINYMSWPVEAQGFASPILEDEYNRMYFLLPSEGVFRAGLKAEMSYNGTTPTTTFKAGVPQPTKAPTLSLINRTSIPEYPNATWVVQAWWSDSGKEFGRVTVNLTMIKPFLAYSFPLPAQPAGTPAGAVLMANLLVSSDGVTLASATVAAGGTTTSNIFPGGIEVALANDGLGKLLLLWGVTETRAYAYTYENTWGEEGAPSPPATISPTYIQDVQIVGYPENFTGYRPYSKYNIYRTYGTSATYIHTDVTPVSQDTGIDDSRSPTSVGTALESSDWFVPPTGLQGMVAASNGWFAAFKGCDLHLSEPYHPHAWPYMHKFPHAIRGVYPTQSALVVTTAGGVYLLNGSYPIATTQTPLSLPQPGVSHRSMTGVDGACAYATHDGFALVAGSVATMEASQKLFTRLSWRERYGDILSDSSLRLSYHDGSLICSSSSQGKGFALRLDEDVGSLSRIDQRMDCTFLLPVNDALYYSVGNGVYEFRGGNGMQAFDWWGKDFIFRSPSTFGVGFIRCEGPITMRLYGDGSLVHQATVTDGYFTIPDINARLKWSVRLSGSSKVTYFALARTMKDLKIA